MRSDRLMMMRFAHMCLEFDRLALFVFGPKLVVYVTMLLIDSEKIRNAVRVQCAYYNMGAKYTRQ